MLPLSKGGGGTPSSDVPGTGAAGGGTEPIGSLAEFQLGTPCFNSGGQRNWEEWQSTTACPASPKKRKANLNKSISIPEDALVHAIETALAKTLQGSSAPNLSTGSPEDVRSLRSEIKESISKVQTQLTQLVNAVAAKLQAEADRRAEEMLRKLMRMLKSAPRDENENVDSPSKGVATARPSTQAAGDPGQQQSARVEEPLNWANVAGKGVQLKASWTTVTSGKKKPKKYPLDQRRVLFTRRSESSDLDPRDIMFEINKALAHARVSVAVRLINLKYTEKGNLSDIVSENACADDLFGYPAIVMPTVQKLDYAVVDMEKTEKWRKLRVHGVALDRYLGEGGLDTAREEIEVMKGEQLPYAPRWIEGDTLGERFDNGSIKRSTLVLTVKSKKAADTIMAKGLFFGGRRHEAERFWERGEGGICTHCCGRDHFGKCVEEARCFVCAGEHEGSKHGCTVGSCGKRSEPCEHQAAKCANCKGAHMATSLRCLEKWSRTRRRKDRATETGSSPLPMETDGAGGNVRASEEPSPAVGRGSSAQATPKLPDATIEESIPELMMEMFWPKSLVTSLQTPILVESSSESHPMSVDDDSAST